MINQGAIDAAQTLNLKLRGVRVHGVRDRRVRRPDRGLGMLDAGVGLDATGSAAASRGGEPAAFAFGDDGRAGQCDQLLERICGRVQLRGEFFADFELGAAARIGDIDLACREVSLEGCHRVQALPAGVP